jgi:hypothetical protein
VTAFIAKFTTGWIHLPTLRAGHLQCTAALVAKLRILWIFKLALRTFHFGCPSLNASIDELVKSQKTGFSVIPAKAGIQLFQGVLDPGFRRGDDPKDFLRDHQS